MLSRPVIALVLFLALPRLVAAQTAAYGFVPQIDDTVAVIDTSTRTVVATIAVGSVPTAAVPSPDGRWVYVTSNQDDTISVIDVATRTVVGSIVLPAGPFSVAFSADARTAFVACDVSEVLVVIDVATRTVQDVGARRRRRDRRGPVAGRPDRLRRHLLRRGAGRPRRRARPVRRSARDRSSTSPSRRTARSRSRPTSSTTW